MKSRSAKVVFTEFPRVDQGLSGSELWNTGYL